MAIHSSILVHWTGKKDIEKHSGNDKRCQYIDRLRDYYQHGLYAKRTTEKVVRGWKIKNLVRICFTEIRLSRVEEHAKQYGRLGIGFAKQFIMDKGGRPVIYVPRDAPKGTRLLEDSIRNTYDKSKGDEDIHRWAKWVMTHVKQMEGDNGEPFFEELEWRLVFDERSPHFTHVSKGVFRMRFSAADVKVIIVPDEISRQMAITNSILQPLFNQHMPTIVTLDECSDF